MGSRKLVVAPFGFPVTEPAFKLQAQGPRPAQAFAAVLELSESVAAEAWDASVTALS